MAAARGSSSVRAAATAGCCLSRGLQRAPASAPAPTEKNRPMAAVEWPGPPLDPHNSIPTSKGETADSVERINWRAAMKAPWQAENWPILIQ